MEEVKTDFVTPVAGNGTAGLQSQAGNQPATVSGAAVLTGGVNGGNLIEPDIDEDLFKFSSDDTPLMNLMLKAKKVTVQSPEVDHFSIDEPTATVTANANASSPSSKIDLASVDKMKVHAYDVLTVNGVFGYEYSESGGSIVHTQSSKPLQVFVTKVEDDDTIVVKAINGVKTSITDEYGTLPTSSSPSGGNTNYITDGTKMILLGNALYETQKKVDPDLVLPQPERVYLQKRGMNSIVSDYFDSQRKRIPFTRAIIAEAAIRNFKTKGNRTLWISQKAKFRVKAIETGDMQYVYNTEGIRWQFKREVEHTGKWTYEQFIGLAKLFYTGEDAPKSCLVLCGKNFLESIQCIDWNNHPEARIDVKVNEKMGWKVTAITTVFGEFQFKREPTLDRIGYENCAAFLGEDRLVHYQRKGETSFNEKVEGEEATRSGILVWDALALKGSCHIWVDGKGGETAPGADEIILWDSDESPTADTAPATGLVKGNAINGSVYYFTEGCTLTSKTSAAGSATTINAKVGEAYKAAVTAGIAGTGGEAGTDGFITWTKHNLSVNA